MTLNDLERRNSLYFTFFRRIRQIFRPIVSRWLKITVCMVVQNTVVRVVQKSIGNGTFGGAATEKPLNRLKQNLAWVIMSGTPLSIPNGMLIGSGGDPHEGVKC